MFKKIWNRNTTVIFYALFHAYFSILTYLAIEATNGSVRKIRNSLMDIPSILTYFLGQAAFEMS